MQYEQDAFWRGEFGDAYVQRNQSDKILASKIGNFSKALRSCGEIKEILEFGSNVGLNLVALHLLLPEVEDISAIEINEKAAKACAENVKLKNLYCQSIHEFEPDYQRDLVVISGVLIHMPPESLPEVYDKLYQSSKKYIYLSEYYNPTPVEVTYRGHSNKLFKRDFCGELMDRYPDLVLRDYGFIYHRDSHFPGDDANWFTLEKR